MCVTELGIVIEVNPHLINTSLPIFDIELGIITNVSFLQSEKASFPMFVTEFGMVTDVSLSHHEKAFSPMLVTE
jgi:hypothetical protein